VAEIGRVSSGIVGLKDVGLSGWFNSESGELAPGFAILPSDVVVDVGSGDGGLSRFCARRAQAVFLVDYDAQRLERAVEVVRGEQGATAEGRVADAASLPFPDGFASRVVCTEVLEHVDDPEKVLAELWRIGRPGALYLLSVPGAASERLQQALAPGAYFEKPHHLRIFEADGFAALVERCGLAIERRGAHGFYWTLWWALHWATGREFTGGFREVDHPLLDAWNHTWLTLLASPEGERIKQALDAFAPHSFALVARKTG
jgi:SAM-dependent methyltransferase